MRITVLKRPAGKHEVVAATDLGAVRFVMADYGAALPHDLAHYVIERALGIDHGFWGLLAAGAVLDTVRAYGARDRRSLPPQTDPIVAEHLDELLAAEDRVAQLYSVGADPTPPPDLDPTVVRRIHTDIAALNATWQALPASESARLDLNWP
jgi:nucleotide-binding universal stress UspA family protein